MPDPVPTTSQTPEPPLLRGLWAKFGLAGPMAVLAAVLPGIGGGLLLGYLKSVADYLHTHPDNGLVIYICAFGLLSGLAILPTYAQSVLGGYAFGLGRGGPAAVAGCTLGALIGYEVARRAAAERVMRTIESKPEWSAIRDAFVSGRSGGFLKTTGIVILLRISPNSPFAIMNLLMAAVRVPRAAFLLGTLIGIAPRTMAMAWVGHKAAGLADSSVPTAMPKWMLVSGILSMLVVLGVMGIIANRAVARFARGSNAPA